MKRQHFLSILLTIGVILFRVLGMYAQPTGANWVFSRTYTNSSASSSSSYVDVTYYDGLGLPEQTVNAAASPDGRSIVTPIFRDSLFRTDARTYLPYEAAYSSEAKQSEPFVAARYEALYGFSDSGFAWSAKELDSFAAGRIAAEIKPGAVYHQNDIATVTTYGTNSSTDNVLKINPSGNNLTIGSYYAKGTLKKVITTDEDGKKTAMFTDKLGRDLLTRQYLNSDGSLFADTYFVYDDANRLICVLSPEASASISANSLLQESSSTGTNLCSFYRYDGQGRMTRRRLAGKGWEYFVYDKGGRLVLSQDAALRTSNRWIYTVYDNLGRPTDQSVVTSTTLTQEDIQTTYDADGFDNSYPTLGGSIDYRVPLSSGFTFTSRIAYYRYGGYRYRASVTNPNTISKFTVPSDLSFSAVSGVVTPTMRDTTVSNLKIYEKIYIFGETMTGNYSMERAFYYDNRGRVIQTVERNAMGGISRTSVKYDFCDRPLIVHEAVRTSSMDTTDDVKQTTYTYDDRGRILSETCTLNGGTAGTVAYAYDGVGRLQGQTYGNGFSETRQYTTQGWLSRITVKDGNDDSQFSQSLKYSDANAPYKKYSGAVGQEATLGSNHTSMIRSFNYDLLGRITSTVTSNNPRYADTDITYDRNGNILTAKRYDGSFTPNYEQLSYSYTGNLLTGLTVTTTEGGSPSTSSYSYTYNPNGSLKNDGRRGVTVFWNAFGMPIKVTSAASSSTVLAYFQYMSDGTKVAAAVPVAGSTDTYDGLFYLGSLVYSGNANGYTLEGTDFGGGRITASGNTTSPLYFSRDHLGNVRMISNASGTVNERNNYYVFGERMPVGTSLSGNRYRYAGKEIITAASLGWLDFGARMYDSYTGRWLSQDPLSEKYPSLSPYAYCANNPMNLVDPEGMDIYRYNRENGDFILHETTEDHFDQVGKFNEEEDGSFTLAKNKDGSYRTEIDRIEKGILHDGINFKNQDVVLPINEQNGISLEGAERFVLELSDMIYKEISGAYYSTTGDGKITHFAIGKYNHNKSHESRAFGIQGFARLLFPSYSEKNVIGVYHTHPFDLSYTQDERQRPSSHDLDVKESYLTRSPHLLFYILTLPNYGSSTYKFPY